MKKLLIVFFIGIAINTNAQDIIQKMYTAHAKNFRKSLSFVQQTNTYRNDSLIKTATWYEVLVYPDKLRIDIDDPSKGNSIFFVNDSIYRSQKMAAAKAHPIAGVLAHARSDTKCLDYKARRRQPICRAAGYPLLSRP